MCIIVRMDDLIQKLEAMEGGAALAAEFKAALDGHKATLRAAEKAATKAEAERVKLAEAMEAASKGESEQLAKLRADAEKHAADLATERQAHRAYRIESKLSGRLPIPAGDDSAARRSAALKLGDWSGVDLDDKGELVGADAALESLAKAHAYLFAAPAPAARGNGGPPAALSTPGAPLALTPAGDDAAAREAGRAVANRYLGTTPTNGAAGGGK